ncbi:hypothetical protein [Moheibacter stercoris]
MSWNRIENFLVGTSRYIFLHSISKNTRSDVVVVLIHFVSSSDFNEV